MKGLGERGQTESWLHAASPPMFPSSHIDIWRVRLDEPAKPGVEANVLSPDENARAARFKFEKDRLHFIRCRSALRILLASYVAAAPQELRFEYGPSGKTHVA